MKFQRFTLAEQLPDSWNERAENYFQLKKFLLHTEKYNPCQQRYYLCEENEKIAACAIIYTLRLDILTFLKIKSPLKMHICGVPCSVSSSGIFGNSEAIEKLKDFIREKEKGFLLFLNLTEKPVNSKYAFGKTLPTIIMKNEFSDWNNYLTSLRSSYRRRIKLMNNNDEIEFQTLKCNSFDNKMYAQYLEVFNHSKGKLEKLSLDFFKNLPDEFVLTSCNLNNEILGWNLGLLDENIYYFFLGGINYNKNKNHNTYFRLLSNLVKNGIESKAEIIELGQTAETAKMRFGGNPYELWMEASHSNPLFNRLIKLFSPMLEYKYKPEKNRVNKI